MGGGDQYIHLQTFDKPCNRGWNCSNPRGDIGLDVHVGRMWHLVKSALGHWVCRPVYEEVSFDPGQKSY